MGAAMTTEGDTRNQTTDEITERVRLSGWGEDIDQVPGVRALLFGEMVKRAIPVVQHYLSDLYHDVRYIDKYVTGPCVFWYMPREWGVNIGMDRDLVIYLRDDIHALYRVEITCEDRVWWATFTPEVA